MLLSHLSDFTPLLNTDIFSAIWCRWVKDQKSRHFANKARTFSFDNRRVAFNASAGKLQSKLAIVAERALRFHKTVSTRQTASHNNGGISQAAARAN